MGEGLNVTLDNLRGWVQMNGRMWVRDLSEGELCLGLLVLQRV